MPIDAAELSKTPPPRVVESPDFTSQLSETTGIQVTVDNESDEADPTQEQFQLLIDDLTDENTGAFTQEIQDFVDDFIKDQQDDVVLTITFKTNNPLVSVEVSFDKDSTDVATQLTQAVGSMSLDLTQETIKDIIRKDILISTKASPEKTARIEKISITLQAGDNTFTRSFMQPRPTHKLSQRQRHPITKK